MSTSFVIKSSDVPVGVYSAKFIGVERTTHLEYGGGLKFAFEILEGNCKGKTCYRTTGDKPTPRNVAGKVLSALAGTKASDGLSIDADALVGKEYVITVGESESGFTRVNEILPAKDSSVPF